MESATSKAKRDLSEQQRAARTSLMLKKLVRALRPMRAGCVSVDRGLYQFHPGDAVHVWHCVDEYDESMKKGVIG